MTTYPATYCPDCGTHLEERRVEDRDRRYCTDCERVVWHTPVPGAGVAVVGAEGVLCGRRAIEPGRGNWAVPGGHVEAGEAPAETAARELAEEVGLAVDPDALRLLGTHAPSLDDGKHMVVVDYAVPAGVVGGTPTPGPEVDAVEWVRPGEIEAEAFHPNHGGIVRRAWERFGGD